MATLLVAAPAAAEDTVRIFGTVSTPAGAYEDGATIRAHRYRSGEEVAQSTIAADGSYSMTVPAYESYIVQTHLRVPVADGETTFALEAEVVEPSKDVEVDLTGSEFLPVTVRLIGADGLPRAGGISFWCSEQVESNWHEGDGTGVRDGRHTSSWREGAGDFTVWGFPIEPEPWQQEGCGAWVYPERGSIQELDVALDPADNVIEVVIPDPVLISGTVALPSTGDSHASIEAFDLDLRRSTRYAEVKPDGSYELWVSPGRYHVKVGGSTRFPGVESSSFQLRSGELDVSSDLAVDLGSWAPTRFHLVDELGGQATGAFDVACHDPTRSQRFSLFLTATGSVDLEATPTNDDWQCVTQLAPFTTQHPIEIAPTGAEFTLVMPRDVVLAGAPGASNDDDGVPDLLEALGPNGGDGNGDGTLDVDQAHVTSLPANGSTDPGDPYVTIAAPGGTTLEDVSTLDPATLPTPPPTGTTLPAGLASFTLSGIGSGTDQVVTIHTSDTTGVNGYAKYDATTQTWSTLPSERVTVFADRVEITLTDGGVGDADGVADGRIVDPGGIAVVPEGDRTPPEVTGTLQRPPDANGWYNAPVSVDWSATDPSGVGALPPPTEVTTEGSAVTATSPPVCDLAEPANCGTGEVSGIKLDLTPPHVEVNGPTDGATYTLGEVPGADCAATDALSGLAGPCSINQVGGNSNGVGFFVATAEAVDEAGNRSATRIRYRVVYRVDGFLPPVNDPAISPGEAMSVFRRPSVVPVALQITDAHGATVEPVIRPVWLPPVRGDRTRAPVNEAFYRGRGSSGWLLSWRDGAWRYAWDTDDVDRGYTYRLRVLLDDGTVREVTIGLR